MNSYSFVGSFLYLAASEESNPENLIVTFKENYINNHDISLFLKLLVDLNDDEVEAFSNSFLFDINGGSISFSNNKIIAL